MPTHYGQKSTFTSPEGSLSINIEDQIKNYPTPRLELIKRLDGSNFADEVRSHEYKWSSRGNRPIKTKVSIDFASGATVMKVDDAGVFNKDDVFRKPDGQICRVLSVAGGTLVTFEAVSGTAEAVTAGEYVTVIGVAAAQGANADEMVISGFSDMYNYSQIFEDVVDLSGTQNAAMIRGDEGSGKLIARKQQELMEKLQTTLVLGVRHKDDVGKVTYTGGLKFMIDTYAPTNKVDFGGSNTWSTDAGVFGKLDDALDIVAAKAFDKPVMYVGSKFMRKFKYVQDDLMQIELTEKQRGLGAVGKYMSHLFGNIEIVLIQDRAGIMDDLVFLVDESMIGYKAVRNRGWKTEQLARMGDSYRWQVLGEYIFKMDIPEASVYLYNLGV